MTEDAEEISPPDEESEITPFQTIRGDSFSSSMVNDSLAATYQSVDSVVDETDRVLRSLGKFPLGVREIGNDPVTRALETLGSNNTKLFIGFNDYPLASNNYQRMKSFEEVSRDNLEHIEDLLGQVTKLRQTTRRANQSEEEKAREVATLKNKVGELSSKLRRAVKDIDRGLIFQKLNELGKERVLEDDPFHEEFSAGKVHSAFVLSIDVRKSTTLMDNAVSPGDFAAFMSELCTKMSDIVVSNYGVFDKFTGDGVLAYFPEFYSGPDAGYYVIKTALECHKAFEDTYRKHEDRFTQQIVNTGLGVGIDYGDVTIARIKNDLTIVGKPVVMACRLGDAKAGQTLLNIRAMPKVRNTSYGQIWSLERVQQDIKESAVWVYQVSLISNDDYKPRKPKWLSRSGGSKTGPTPDASAEESGARVKSEPS